VDSEQDANLISICWVDSLEGHVGQQVVRQLTQGPPRVDQSAFENLAFTINSVANRLKAINLNLTERVFEIVGRLVIPPWITVPVEDPDALDAGDALA
jgi:hypothetical protein